jgi:YD repeat-containing protein
VAHDTAGRLTGESSPDFGAITATLDANGNRTARAYPAPAGFTATFTYDALNRLTGAWQGSRLAGYAYNPLSQRSPGEMLQGQQAMKHREGQVQFHHFWSFLRGASLIRGTPTVYHRSPDQPLGSITAFPRSTFFVPRLFFMTARALRR